MSGSDERASIDLIDPELRPFVARLAAAWASHPPLESVEPVERRRIAEVVRAPWTAGGPTMLESHQYEIPDRDGLIPVQILHPTMSKPSPVLIYLHGGGWTIFSTRTHDRVMREYAARAGLAVVGVDYSLAPEARFPKPVEETCAVIDWIREQGHSFGLDGSQVILGGDSAGAHIALGSCLTLRDRGAPSVQGLVLNYGAIDDDFDRPSYRRFGRGGFTLGTEEMAAFWQQYLGEDIVTDSRARPLRADLTGLPPTRLTIAELDPLVDENLALATALEAAGVPTSATVYPATIHSFLEAVSIAAVSDRAYRDTAAWLDRLLEKRPPNRDQAAREVSPRV